MNYQNLATPPEFMEWVKLRFGTPQLDVAADESNTKAVLFFNEKIDGLKQNWSSCLNHEYPVVWCNPPYKNAKRWAWKAYEEVQRNENLTVLLLTHATFSAWSYKLWDAGFQHRIMLTPRISFIYSNSNQISGNSRDSMLTVFSQTEQRTMEFCNWHEEKERLKK